MKTLTIREYGKPIYDIVFSADFNGLPAALERLGIENRKICIVSETRVASIYMAEVKALLEPIARDVIEFVFPEGEASKNLSTVQHLYETLILAHFDRKDLLIALGGGVVGDLTGYAAATYLRGIDFVQVPTSLLAQVDSSIGGKTGVDFNAYKNMVGAFHQPKLVYMNFSTLKTLSERQFFSGMGEIIKHGLIKDISYYQWIKEHKEEIHQRNVDVLSQLVYRSCEIKGQVVENDPTEQGERALLNFGHTLGHAVEKLADFSLLHGECVSLGIVGAAKISLLRNDIDLAAFEDIKETLSDYKLPVALSDAYLLCVDDIVSATKMDKKMEAGSIKFILLSPEGHGVIDKTVTDQELSAGALALGGIQTKP